MTYEKIKFDDVKGYKANGNVELEEELVEESVEENIESNGDSNIEDLASDIFGTFEVE